MKTGIVTIFKANNYGAVLQAYGLSKVLESLGHQVQIIDYEPEAFKRRNKKWFINMRLSIATNIKHIVKHYILRRDIKRNKRFDDFRSESLNVSSPYDSKYNNIKYEFDCLIAGSDQIWNPEYTDGKLDEGFLLSNANSIMKLSYASSAGSYQFDDENRNVLLDSLRKFKSVAVREESLRLQLVDAGLADTTTVLDPTLLADKSIWDKLCSDVALNIAEKYLLIYTFDNNPLCFSAAKAIAKERKLKVVFISQTERRFDGVDIYLRAVSPREFVWLFKHSEYVITNSFHGTCFSLIYEKPFYSVLKRNNPGRVQNLLDNLSLSSRLLYNIAELSDNSQIDYSSIRMKLSDLRICSLNYLKRNLYVEE